MEATTTLATLTTEEFISNLTQFPIVDEDNAYDDIYYDNNNLPITEPPDLFSTKGPRTIAPPADDLHPGIRLIFILI